MPTVAEIKQQYPDLADSTDDQVVDALHQAFYADLPRDQIASRLGVKPTPAPAEKSGPMRRLLGDTGVSLVKGAIGVPEAAVGLADLVTGGRAGKVLENEGGMIGFRPKQAKAALDELYSPEQKAANAEVQNAHGIVDTAKAALSNPSVIAQSAIESLPAMGAGGVVGRGLTAIAPRVGAAVAGGVGEGVTTMGQQAESVRQETPDGLLTGQQAALAAGSGALTGTIGVGAGRLAQKLGIENVETLLAGGHADPVAKAGLVRRVLGGALTEGVLEELPQSVQEQVAQNLALGKPLDEGVDQAAVLGVLTGGAMGAGAQAFHGKPAVKSAGDVIREDLQPEVGPLTAAVNAGIEDAAKKADAAQPVVDVPHPPRAANAAAIAAIRALPPEQQQDALHLQALGNRMDVAPGVRRYAQNRLDKLLGDLQPLNPEKLDAKTGEPVPEPTPTVAAPKAGNEADQTLARQESMLRASEADAAAQRERDRPPIPTGEPQEGDLLNLQNQPFTTMPGAMRALKAAGDGHTIVRVGKGLVVRKIQPESPNELASPAAAGSDAGASAAVAAAPGGTGIVGGEQPAGEPGAGPVAEPVASTATAGAADRGADAPAAVAPHIGGEHIADGFHAFTPESGTLGVPRAEMPQVRADHRGALTQFLAARGITHEQAEVPADSLKPTQAEFSPAKVIKAMEFDGTDRAILTSSDGYVVDGHHQFMARREAGQPIRVIRFDAPIAELLPVVREFPSATQADGATQASPTHEQDASRGTNAPAQAEAAPAADARSDGPAPAVAEPAGPAVAGPAEVVPAGLTAPAAEPKPAKEGAVARRKRLIAEREAAPKPLDHGELNVPGRTNSINAQLDKHKAGQAAATKTAAKETALQRRNDKLEAKRLLAEHEAGMVASLVQKGNGKITAKEAANELDQLAKWEPKKLISVAQSYLKNSAPSAPAAAPAPAKPKRATAAQRAYEAMNAKRADYFTPGNIVKGYGGFDEVLDYTPPTDDANWSVRVHHVEKKGDTWVRIGKPQDARNHSTQPDERNLKEGPVARVAAAAAADVPHTEPRADGKAFPNATARGAAEEPAVDPKVLARMRVPSPYGKPWPYPNLGGKNAPAGLHDGQRAVVDYMNGDIDKPEMMKRLAAGPLQEGQLWSITNRLEDDFVQSDMNALEKLRAASAAKTDDEPAFSRSDSPESRALKALSENDDLFALPKSTAKTVEAIATDNDPGIKVRAFPAAGLSRYLLTMPDGTIASLYVREPSPYGPHSYGSTFNEDNELTAAETVRPGDNPEAVADDVEDVWVDASKLKGAGYGAKLYNIAATFAHNTGRIFIGDPAGLSKQAMVRRPEQMLSSALKFGTTDHIAPHPQQIKGDAKRGVPPLKWVYGDHEGNVRRLIDLNLAAQDNAGNTEITFDSKHGQFHDSSGQVIDRAGIDLLAQAGLLGDGNGAGGRTTARAAVLRALLRDASSEAQVGDGQRVGVLARLAGDLRDGRAGTRGIFYSRTGGVAREAATAARTAEVQHLVDLITARWKNAPEVIVAPTMQHALIPEALRDYDQQQRSEGADGEPDGFYADGKVYLIASQLPGDAHVVRVLMHESLGHYGLRGVFGQQLGTILDRMAILQAGKVRTKAKQYGLDYDKPSERRKAAEEVLAEMAQNHPELGWVQQVIAAIRAWVREHIPGARGMKLSDEEIVYSYIMPARAFVKAGPVSVSRAAPIPDGVMASRSLGGALGEAMGSVKNVNLPAGYKVADLMDSTGKLSVWHKTVGSQFNLAKRSPAFKRVFDGVQSFLNDANYFTTEAANKAPKLLPKLEGWRDIAKSPISAADTKAIAAPIFEGTLTWARDAAGKPVQIDSLTAAATAMDSEQKARALFKGGHVSEQVLKMWQGLPADQFDAIINGKYERDMLKAGVVWTDDELRSMFKATDEQIGLYREFRAATDESLSNLATSEMVNYAGKDVDAVRAQALALGHDQAAVLLRDHLFEQAAANPARAEELNETANKMIEIADHATDMQKRGYAPLSRFGTYTLDATLATGERYFSLFETTRERARMQRQLAAAGATEIKAGTMSQEDYKLLNGISPETAMLFGEMLDLDRQGSDAKDKAFTEFIKRGTSNRSAMKRLLKRQGIAGFSEDAGRVLAGFVYSNGRKTSSNLHMGEVTSAVNDMDKQGGEIKDAAVRLADYVKNPQEEAQALRALLFAQYLGGSVASAMVNATQPFTVTLPYLSQFGGIAKAGKQMAAALKVAGKETTGDKDLDAALKKASEEGTLSPQEVHQLMAQAQGKSALKSGDGTALGNAAAQGSNVLAKVSLAWGKVFGVAEQFNRRVTFIAAYRTAQDQGIADPSAFALNAVNETQFISNKGNKSRWGRGAIGGTLMTFRSYAIQYLELLHRMATAGEPGSPERAAGRKAALLAVGVLFLMGGADGLPFEANIEDLIDAFMQHLGYNFSSKRAKQEFFANLFGEDMGRFVNKGLSGLPGAPIDVSGRMGMGRLVPGTGLFAKKADHTSDVTELAGPVADLAKRAGQAAGALMDGNLVDAGRAVMPVAARNIDKSVDMLKNDAYRDTKGRKVIDTTPTEAVLKAIGFQPNSVARVQEATGEVQQAIALTKLRQTELSADMAQAMYEKDADKVAEVREALKRWNESNPDAQIRLSMPAVIKRVKAMREDKATRLEKTAPKSMRAEVRRELQDATQ
jgi:hypothetical protein